MSKSTYEAVGWIGVGLILGAFALTSFGMLSSQSLAFQSMNAAGAFGVVLQAKAKRDRPVLFLNTVWMFVALVAIGRIVL